MDSVTLCGDTAIQNFPRWQLAAILAASCHLGFDITRNSAIRSADPENPTIEPNMKCIGSLVVEIWPFAYHGGIWDPILGEGEVVGVSDGTIQKSDGGFL